jgi:hypothetical protein
MHRRVPRAPGKAFAAVATAALLSLSMTAGASASMAASAGAAGPRAPKAGLFSPSGGTPIPTSTSCTGFVPLPARGCAMAGYQASGRDFRYAQAVITVPDHQGVVSGCPPGARCIGAGRPSAPRGGAIRDDPVPAEADPQLYVALDNSSTGSSQFARVGIQPCTAGGICGSSGWEAYVQVVGFSVPPSAPVGSPRPITAANEGDEVFVSVYSDPADQAVHTEVTLPDGSTFNNTFPDRGAIYPRAQAVADWTTATTKPQPVAPSPGKVRDAQFLEGRFTTLNGQQGTFAGPWSLNAFEGTTNAALPPDGTLVAQPSYLWNDGTNFRGLFGDAFGVWRFPF